MLEYSHKLGVKPLIVASAKVYSVPLFLKTMCVPVFDIHVILIYLNISAEIVSVR